jgi:hypothetical protein
MMIFLASRSRRKGAKFRCLFLSKILIHTPIQQRQILSVDGFLQLSTKAF